MKKTNIVILKFINEYNFKWAIIHKFDEISKGNENDVDIFIEKPFFSNQLEDFRRKCEESHIKIIKVKKMVSGISFCFYSEKYDETVKYDFVYDMPVLFLSFLKVKKILRDIDKSNQNYPCLNTTSANFLYDYKISLREKPFKFLINSINSEFLRILPAFYFFKYITTMLYNFKNISGRYVILVGPDGSGKSSALSLIKSSQKRFYFSVRTYHFNFKLFPRLNNFKLQKTKDPDYTLPNSGTFAPIQPLIKSIFFCLYYGLELIITSNLRARLLVSNGSLVVFDRYFHDYFFQRSYRKAPGWLIKIILNLTFKPNLIIYLTGDSKIINQRKNELSPDEIEIQQKLIEKKLIKYWVNKKISVISYDTTKNTPHKLLDVIKNYI